MLLFDLLKLPFFIAVNIRGLSLLNLTFFHTCQKKKTYKSIKKNVCKEMECNVRFFCMRKMSKILYTYIFR